jgi:glyoxylase-like metal-dependent hydrolase (beta-lactamase superfamily II)
MGVDITAFHDEATGTVTYAVADPLSGACAVIDSVLDLDPASGRTRTISLHRVTEFIDTRGLRLEWILETHLHADHLSGAATLRELRGGRIGIGIGVERIRSRWEAVFPGVRRGRDAFDRLLRDGDRLPLGTLELRVMETPGHTPACVTYLIEGNAFVGDALFMPQAGTARCDFPGGDARTLYRSLRRLLELPGDVRVFTAHDYGHRAGGQARWQSTLAQQRRDNPWLSDDIDEDEFVRRRTARDRSLEPPGLMVPALQVNLCGGRLPERAALGAGWLRQPLPAGEATDR